MSLFRRSIISTLKYPNTYVAKFQMKFDLENYDYTQYGLHMVADSTNKVNTIDKYGIGFFLTYGVTRDDYAECKQFLGILEENVTIGIEISTESTKYAKSIVLPKGSGFGISINLIHDASGNDEINLAKINNHEGLSTDAYNYQYKDAALHATRISNIDPPIAYIGSPDGVASAGNDIYEKVFVSTQNLLPEGNTQIYTVTLTIQSLQAFEEKSLEIWNCAHRLTSFAENSDSKSAPTTYDYYACQCKCGTFEGDSAFEDKRFRGVE